MTHVEIAKIGCAASRLGSRAKNDDRRRRVVELLRSVAHRHANVRFIDPIEVFCDTRVCRPNDGHTLYLRDHNHVSYAGAARIYQAFAADFAWVFEGGR